jgi:anti-sigma-K factor RskA
MRLADTFRSCAAVATAWSSNGEDKSELVSNTCQDVKRRELFVLSCSLVEKLVQQDAPELERRLTELQSQVNRLSLSLHLWQERQDKLLEQRLTDWSTSEARAQKDVSTRVRELQETVEHEWGELRKVQQDPQYLRELGSSLERKLSDLNDQMQVVVSELRANGAIRGQSLQPATQPWPLDDVVRLHNQLRDAANGNGHEAEHVITPRAPLVLPAAPPEILERLETLERSVGANESESGGSVTTAWRVAVVLLAVSIGVAGVLVGRLQNQVTAATARVSQAEQQAQVATKSASDQIAAARQEASQQIAQAREAAEKAQTISDVLAAPDLIRFNLVGGDETSSFTAQVLLSRSRGMVFSESRLPSAPKDSTYQIWLLTNGAAASVGTFVPDANGRYSMATATLPRIQLPVIGVQVTVERTGGSGAPTGRVVLTRPQPAVAAAPPATTP